MDLGIGETIPDMGVAIPAFGFCPQQFLVGLRGDTQVRIDRAAVECHFPRPLPAISGTVWAPSVATRGGGVARKSATQKRVRHGARFLPGRIGCKGVKFGEVVHQWAHIHLGAAQNSAASGRWVGRIQCDERPRAAVAFKGDVPILPGAMQVGAAFLVRPVVPRRSGFVPR